MLTNVIDTSIAAWRALPAARLTTQCDAICMIVSRASTPLSLREIKAEYDRLLGANIDVSTVSARVNALCDVGRLERRKATRPCAHSGVNIHPVGLPLAQLEMML